MIFPTSITFFQRANSEAWKETTEIAIERVEPEALLSYRWHPYAIDPKVDYSGESMTRVEFQLADVDGAAMFSPTVDHL